MLNAQQNNNDTRLYDFVRVNDKLAFIFSPELTLVITPLQLSKIVYGHRNYAKRLADLKKMVTEGHIKNIVDLVDYCAPKPGPNSQMYGLELISMNLAWMK